MADWFERLFKAFIEFRPARNWKCRFHNGRHYQDAIITGVDGVKWYLHDKLIAKLKAIEYPIYELYLTDAGYSTVTTISRLNGIIWLFKSRLGIDLGIEFRLKYNGGFGRGYPIYTYIMRSDGTEYKIPYVTVRFNALTREVLATSLPRDYEIMHFMNHRDNKKLMHVRRVYYRLVRVKRELWRIAYKLRYDYYDHDNPVLSEIDNYSGKVYDFENHFGLPYGVYSRIDLELVENVLRNLIKEGEAVLLKARETLAEAMLLNM
jgi:hypothetical protein